MHLAWRHKHKTDILVKEHLYRRRRFLTRAVTLVIICFGIATTWMVACRKPFEPAVIREGSSILVVDGTINIDGANPTVFTLSRTSNLSDSAAAHPEPLAGVDVEAKDGRHFNLREVATGQYQAQLPALAMSGSYRVNIRTNDGAVYQSDFAQGETTPVIDSLHWQQGDGVRITVATHDPANSTHFYRWELDETYEYHSAYDAIWLVENGMIRLRDTSERTHICYLTRPGPNIVTASTIQLSQDVVTDQQLVIIPQGSEKLQFKYSVLVRQYALSAASYNYWQILKKNSQELGSLFDAQPSQLVGNLHCVSSPSTPVIGYVTASTITQKRLIIDNAQLTQWPVTDTSASFCTTKIVDSNYPFYLYPDTAYTVYFFPMNGGMSVAPKKCIDCTLRGGTTIKPSFW
jgi:Domain of unknown function (DUF4249)